MSKARVQYAVRSSQKMNANEKFVINNTEESSNRMDN